MDDGSGKDRAIVGALRDLSLMLRRRKWLIVAITLIGTTAAIAIGSQVPRAYSATALVRVDNSASPQVDVGPELIEQRRPDQLALETEVRLLTSAAFVDEVMRRNELYDHPYFAPQPDSKGRFVEVEDPFARFARFIPNDLLIATGIAKEQPAERITVNREAVAAEFRRSLNVGQQGRSLVIGVSFTADDPQFAADVANMVVKTYVARQLERKQSLTSEAATALETRLEEMRADVERAERAVADWRRENGIRDTGQMPVQEQELVSVNAQLINAKTELAERQTKLRLARDLLSRGQSVDSIADVLSSATIVDLRSQEAQLLRQVAELSSSLGERHPRMINLRAEVDNLQSKIDAEVRRIVDNLATEARLIGARVATLEAEFQRLSAASNNASVASVRLQELEREAATSRDIYERFLQRSKEITEQADFIASDAEIVSEAAVPQDPSSLGLRVFALLGFVGSLGLGSITAVLLEKMDAAIRNGDQVEKLLEQPLIGLVPRVERLAAKQKPHQYLIAKPLSIYADAISSVHTAVELADPDNPPQVVQVTSSVPDEGKTTLAVSLAAYIARLGQKVIIVDLDLRHPSVAGELGIKPRLGLAELLSQGIEPEEVIGIDETSGVHYLVVARRPAHPMRFVRSRRMLKLFRYLRERYDYVIVDSAPALGVTESKVLSLLVDSLVFCCRWGDTDRNLAKNGIAKLVDADAPIAGVVLTQVDWRRHAQYDYGDSGQYYAKYAKYYAN